MKTAVSILFALTCACACGRGPAGGGTGTGTGTGGGGGTAPTCEAVSAHVADLYAASARTEYAGKDATTVAQLVADNTAMVMSECKRYPGKVAGCAAAASSAAALEHDCLAPLDDEGTEGDVFRAK